MIVKDSMDTTREIKEEPCVETTLNEAKSGSEEPQIPHLDLQGKVNFEMECKKSTSLSAGNKPDIKVEVKEEPLWEDRTSTDLECSTELTQSDPVSQSNTKDSDAACIIGIDEDFPSAEAESRRSPSNSSCSDTSGTLNLTTDSGFKKCGLQMKEINSDFQAPGVYKGNESSFHENSFTRKTTLKVNRTQDSKQPFECLICGKSFKQKSNLKRHKLIHSVPKQQSCNICGRSFKLMAHFKRHVLSHSDPKPHKCDICDKKFAHLSKLKRHILIHSGIKPYNCDLCEKSFAELSLLKNHIIIHSGLKLYKCDMCEKSYNNKGCLMRHTLIHADTKPYECDICNKGFNDRSVLIRHKMIHSGSKPYKCDTCEKSFNSKPRLNRHTLIHSDTKPYECDICNKGFNDRSVLVRHKAIHSGAKPYLCDICERSFNQSSALKRHKLRH